MTDIDIPSAPTTVPRVSPELSGVQIHSLHGFRSQEAWGRWTLGKVTAIELNALKSEWIAANLTLTLPLPDQTLQVWLNDSPLGQIRTLNIPAKYNIWLVLPLRQGSNQLRLLTNKSNLDPRFRPFAPHDHSDIAISVENMLLQPILHGTGQLYSIFRPVGLQTYDAALNNQVILFIPAAGAQQLNYSVLATTAGQHFQIRLGRDTVTTFTAPHAGSLMNGTVNLRPHLQQRLTITTTLPPLPGRATSDQTFRLLAEQGGQSSFYVQRLSLMSPVCWKQFELPLALTGVLVFLLWLGLLLFRRSTDH
ncbi:hypothetical protein [Deinococcus aerophilus]|uniref:DUF3999 domain-containing protein n=1 Tax=Deinococcus aerophilus TaxID=522488 RepID=A0ABQ2GXL2_9DEIO|nr:hypothetical protein [Deinococcus aerophilus]GGM18627.1 hypothetical protein GCM10010841_28430 [Deinococcus aerophilus]